MSGLLNEIIYRPALLLLSVVIGSVLGSACLGLQPFYIFFAVFLLLFFFYRGLCFRKIRPGLSRFLLLSFLAVLTAGITVYKISERRAGFLRARVLLSERQAPGSRVHFTGTVSTFPKGSPDGWQLRLTPYEGVLTNCGDVLLNLPTTVYDDPRLPVIGDVVSIKIRLRPLKPARHPFLRGHFRKQVLSGLVARAKLDDFADMKIVGHSSYVLSRIEKLRRSLYRLLFTAASGDQKSAAILQAVLLGTRDQLSSKVKELFLDLGVFHLFAISGLHLSVVVTLFFFLIRSLIPDFVRRRLVRGTTPIAAGLTILFLPGYVLLAGLHLPVVRAGIMGFFFLTALLSGRLRDPFSILFIAAVVILLVWPESLFSLSFQLSFTAVATILGVVPQARKFWARFCLPLLPQKKMQKMPQKKSRWQKVLENGFYLGASSVAISLTTAPLLINRVHFVSLYSLIANLILIPLFSLIIIPLGMLALLFFKFPGIMLLLIKPLCLLLHYLVAGGNFLREILPSGRLYLSALTSFEMVLAGLLIFTVSWFFITSGSKKKSGIILFILCGLVICDWGWWHLEQSRKQISLAAFVGGQPQSLLIEIPGGEAILVNGGSWSGSSGSSESLMGTSFFTFAQNVIAPYCWRRKIRRIDTLVLTEPQRGLLGGLLFLIEHFRVRQILYHGIWSGYPPFRNFCALSKERFGVRWEKISSFSSPFDLNGVEIEIVGPPANDFRFSSRYSDTLQAMAPSLLLHYGDFVGLIWGGGQIDPAVLPNRVDLLALLRSYGARCKLPPDLFKVDLKPGGWFLQPGKGSEKLAESWQSQKWTLKKDGFIFLQIDYSGKITNKLPESLISGCQSGLYKL